jgi:outer membrane protein assembly factor BamB
MKELHYKTKLSTITLILMLAISALLVALPAVTAQPSIVTFAFVDAIPNPVGVGQDVLIRYGVLQQLGHPEDSWTGLSVTVVKPDGTTQTLGDLSTDSTGGSATLFTPNQVGTYELTTNFPAQAFPSTYFDFQRGILFLEGTVVEATTSETLELVVTDELLPDYPGHPLPTEYWSRPVDPQLREWSSVTGNWMQRPDNWFALYNDDAPETAHVLWAKPLTTGGLTGGLLAGVPAGSDTGDAYAGKFIGSVILNGILYYNRDDEYAGSKGIVAVDLHTGKELWTRNNTVLSFGQIFYWNSFNFDGVFTYLWDTSAGSTWKAYDPFSGQWVYTMTDVPSGSRVFGPSGEILIYQIDYVNRWLALWNSTAAGLTAPNFAMDPTTYGSWHNFWGGNLVHGSTINASDPRAYSWNVTIPAGLTAIAGGMDTPIKVYPDRVMAMSVNQTDVRIWALNTEGLDASSTSTSTLFDEWWNAPAAWQEGFVTLEYTGATNEAENGIIALWCKELRKHYAFSTETGKYLWQTDSEHFLNAYGAGAVEHSWFFAYGNFYSTGVSGVLYCYDQETGEIRWTYPLSDIYNEPVTGNYWWAWISIIADGKIYMGHTEHSAENPMPRGAPFVCLNATTGDEIWRVNGMFRQTRWGGSALMGDSIIATMDTYDQRIYAIGKGPSATSITAAPRVTTYGSSVIIEGTVMDVSPGTESPELQLRFPNGVPAVSDESMSDWMLYVYKQFEHPEDVEGVDVFLKVLDPHGEWYSATVTTDRNGVFSHMWTPGVAGEYHVTAMFEGSEGYYASQATTTFGIDPAPAEAPSAEEIAETTVNRMPAYPTITEFPAYLTIDLVILIIVAVGVVIGLIAYMALRKQK